MARVSRFDRGELAKPVRDAEGFLQVEGVIARTCILEYQNPDGGLRHELVTPEELFDPASMRSLAAKALTNDHPSGLLTPETVGTYQIGGIGEPRRDGDRLVSTLGILRADAIAAVEAGKVELSVGYSCAVDETPGDHPTLRCPQCGTAHYDGVQKERRGNHVAIVQRARAGDAARIRLDSAGNSVLPIVATQQEVGAAQQEETPPMPKMLRLDNLQIDAEAPDAQGVIDRTLAQIRKDAADALAAQAKRADTAEASLTAATGKLAALKAGVKKWSTGIKAKLDAMKARMMGCDECGGTKQVDGKNCDYCDGTGAVRMHDKVKGMESGADAPHPDDDMAEVDDELSAEPAEEGAPTPAPAEPAAKKDAATKRAAARAPLQAKRKDSLARMADRRATARAALLTAAGRHLDAAEIATKPDLEIQRAVVAKLAPHVDAAKMDAATIGILYAAETKRADAGGGPAPSVTLTENTLPPAGRTDAARAELQKRIDAANHAMYHSHETPAAK